MEFLRVIKDSNDLAKVLDVPKSLRNRKVEVLIFPYEETKEIMEKNSLRGTLSRYKNEKLQSLESKAWSEAVVEKHENS